MTKTIKIKGKKYELHNRIYRTQWLFEELAEKDIAKANGTKDNLMYIYCFVKASNPEFPYGFDEFADDILTPELLTEISSKMPKAKK